MIAIFSDYTPQLLRILRSEGILATFFVLGETLDSSNSDARKNRQVLKEMWMSGHDIGNHSYDHEAFPSLSLDDVEWQMEKTNELIADVIEAYPTLMRLPYGYTSHINILQANIMAF